MTPTAEQIKQAQEAGNAAYYEYASGFNFNQFAAADAYRAAYDATLAALQAAAQDNPLEGVDWTPIKAELNAERSAMIERDMQAAAHEAGVTAEWTPAPDNAEMIRIVQDAFNDPAIEY